jgi:hypothetical protein
MSSFSLSTYEHSSCLVFDATLGDYLISMQFSLCLFVSISTASVCCISFFSMFSSGFSTSGLFLLLSSRDSRGLHVDTTCSPSSHHEGVICGSPSVRLFNCALSFYKRPICQQLLTASTTSLTSIIVHMVPFRSSMVEGVCSCFASIIGL